MSELAYCKNKFNQGLIWHFIGWVVVYTILGIFLFPKQIEDGMEPTKIIEVTFVFLAFLIVVTLVYKLLGYLSFKSESVLSVAMILCLPLGVVGILVFIPIYKYYHVADYFTPFKERMFERKVLRKTVKAFQAVWRKQNFFHVVIVPLLLLVPSIALIIGIYTLHTMFSQYALIVDSILYFIFYLFVAFKLGGIHDYDAIKTTYGVEIGDTVFDYGDVHLVEKESKKVTETEFDIIAFLLAIPVSFFLIICLAIAIVLFLLCTVLRLFGNLGGMHSIFLKRKTYVDEDYVMGPSFLKKPIFVLNRMLYKLFRINLVSASFWDDQVGFNYIRTQLKSHNKKILERKLKRIEKKYGSHAA